MRVGSAVTWAVVIGAIALGLFQLKHAVQRQEDELARLNRELLASEEAIHVLEAEWSYLNRPERLTALARRHLELEPMKPEQIGGIKTLPMRVDGVGARVDRGSTQ